MDRADSKGLSQSLSFQESGSMMHHQSAKKFIPYSLDSIQSKGFYKTFTKKIAIKAGSLLGMRTLVMYLGFDRYTSY